MKTLFYAGILLIASVLILNTGCKKGELLSSGNLDFSADTIVFDTVFTTIGSTTKHFKFYNHDNKPIKVSDITLMGGASSPYRINVDGVSGTSFQDISLEGDDSLYVFVEVTLDPNNQANPLVIEDSIRFTTNGIVQYVQLAAWGQDAYFHYKDIFPVINSDTTWANDKPHVIYGYAAVDSAKTLNIPAGTDIYLHKNAILYVYKGALNINGDINNRVTLQGDRLEMAYNDVSGQYYGIYFHQALPSTINYAVIKNGTSGIHLFDEDPGNSGYTLNLTNTEIFNCARYGVFIYSGAKVKAENCVIYKNLNHALLVLEGGDFNFNHCHLLGYNTDGGQVPAVGISNYFVDVANSVTNVGSINEGTITNSVIYGDLDHELAIDTLSTGGVTLAFDIHHNLIRSVDIFNDAFFSNNIWNQDPLFKSYDTPDYTFWYASPLRDNGITTPLTLDFNGNPRSLGAAPDIGAYEMY